MEEARQKIIHGAEQLFSRYGIRSITMDEVARHVSVSKKTLYQHFDNKDDLVFAIAKAHMEQDCCMWDSLQSKANNALDEMMILTEVLRKEVQDLNPALVYDLKRFHPKAWSLFEDQRETVFERSIQDNIARGIREGCYRPDLDASVMSRIRWILIISSFDADSFPTNKFDFCPCTGPDTRALCTGLAYPVRPGALGGHAHRQRYTQPKRNCSTPYKRPQVCAK